MQDRQQGQVLEFKPVIDWSALGAPGGKEPRVLVAIGDDGEWQLYHGKDVELEKIDQNSYSGDRTIFPFEIDKQKKTPFGLWIKLKNGGICFCPGSGGWDCCWLVTEATNKDF